VGVRFLEVVMREPLLSWHPGGARDAILRFVEHTTAAGAGLPVADRVAVFDNDGTLWCEKPMPIQLDFIFRRLAEMAQADPTLRDRQPWKAAHERDYSWLAAVVAEHYAGDDTNVRTLSGGVLAAFANISVDAFAAQADEFLRGTAHPTLGRGYLECAYAPMVELLQYLEANGFANYIVSGGGRDFMRPISSEVYGVPSERVIGSSAALVYTPDEHGGSISRQAAADYLDDGPEKPVHIWTRIGRRPVLAAGNSNGDIEMLDFTQHADKPYLRLLVLHDDAEREFDYVSGSEKALGRAEESGWTVVSVKNDWKTVF
jgi:FMN phosphatase YigB (HAD superfamily)